MACEKQRVMLPRGGILVPTGQGPVQYGIPPETIKDTMAEGVPRIFILPGAMFSLEKGISLAEMEFPVYYHFFFKKQKIQVVCSRQQRQRLKIVLTEALFGPPRLSLAPEFERGEDTPGFPDLKAEMSHFRTMTINGRVKQLALSDVVEFILFDDQGTARLNTLRITMDEAQTCTITEGEEICATIDRHQALIPDNPIDFSIRQTFSPPLFGVTTLGSGHGFDPDAMTSGMIIWVNQRGIMVDPPVHSAVDLVRLGVNPKILDSIILTHCHADHDSGTLQKIMLEGKITLYTTPTIFNSFIRKSAALININASRLKKALHFVPLNIGDPVNIHGGIFECHYTFHSIPTISIRASHAGKTLVYSSDTLNDPTYIQSMYEQGIMDKGRRDFLTAFPWDRDLILHEAGVPPLHTPMSFLTSLPAPVRERIYLIHVAQEQIPENSGLKIAPTGLSSTVALPVPSRPSSDAIDILGAFLDLPLFRTLAPEKTLEFLCIATPESFEPGTVLFKKGEIGTRFFMIINGQVDIVEDGVLLTTFSRSDFFGEKCLFSDGPRTADAIAKSHIKVAVVDKRDMLAFIQKTPLETILRRLSIFQGRAMRNILDANPVFAGLTPSQKLQLFQIVEMVTLSGDSDQMLIQENTPVDRCYFVHSGQVRVTREGKAVDTLGSGHLIGVNAIFNHLPAATETITAGPDAVLYQFDAPAIRAFADNNPGVFLKLCRSPF